MTSVRPQRPAEHSGFNRLFPVGASGQLVSPVQTEDPGHQDDLSQWGLCRGQRPVLRAMPKEPLRRRRTHRTAQPGQ